MHRHKLSLPTLMALAISCGADGRAEGGLSTGGGGPDGAGGTDGGLETDSGGGGGATDGGGPGGGDPEPPPPEEEDDADFRTPKTSGRFVYSASRITDRVAVIDSDNLSIDVVDVGLEPTVVRAIPGQAADTGAVAVLNHGSNEVAFIRTDAKGVNTVELRDASDGANNLAVTPDGNYVFVYHDIDGPEELGAGSNQELTVVSTQLGGPSWEMAVGANPRDVQFSDNSSLAYVVTDDGVNRIAIAELDAIGKPDIIPVVLDPGIDPKDLEIHISTSRGQALARIEGGDWVVVTDLETGAKNELILPGIATDLDMSADGTFAILVLPELTGNSTLVEVPLPVAGGPGFQSYAIPGEYVGLSSITPDGQSMVLYTTVKPWPNAGGHDEGELILDPDGFFATGTATTDGMTDGDPPPPDFDPRQRVTLVRRAMGGWSVHTTLFMEVPVTSAGIAPDSRNAILLHEMATELNSQAPWPYTLLDLSKAFPVKKLQMAEARPGPILFTPDGSRAAVLLRDDPSDTRRVDMVNLSNFIVDGFKLGSPPEGAGYVDSTRKIFVSQEHEAGRITFIGDDGSVQTVTGYELNDAVKN